MRMHADGTKTCSKCGETKVAATSFHKNARKLDGYHDLCKPCRGTKTPRGTEKPTHIHEELHVWRAEYQRVCTCIVCGEAATLPAHVVSVEGARLSTRTCAPRCDAHRTTRLTTKGKLKARRWSDHADEAVTTIDLYHTITVVVKNFKTLHKTDGARLWLKGERENVTEAMVDLIHDWIERTEDRAKRHELNQTTPLLTADKRVSVDWTEWSADWIDERRAEAMGDADGDFNSIIDLRLFELDTFFEDMDASLEVVG